MTKFYANGDVCTKVEFRYVGDGINAQKVCCKFVTTFSIEKGVIKNREYVGAKCFYR